jgi:hypothetical protein
MTTSDSGMLAVEVRTAPQPPVRGTDTVELTITSATDGSPVDGLDLEVQPWMPAMNHGTSATPIVTPKGDGKYLVTQLYLFMPGLWQLRTTLSATANDSSTTTDHVVPAFTIH